MNCFKSHAGLSQGTFLSIASRVLAVWLGQDKVGQPQLVLPGGEGGVDGGHPLSLPAPQQQLPVLLPAQEDQEQQEARQLVEALEEQQEGVVPVGGRQP